MMWNVSQWLLATHSEDLSWAFLTLNAHKLSPIQRKPCFMQETTGWAYKLRLERSNKTFYSSCPLKFNAFKLQSSIIYIQFVFSLCRALQASICFSVSKQIFFSFSSAQFYLFFVSLVKHNSIIKHKVCYNIHLPVSHPGMIKKLRFLDQTGELG